VRNLLEALGSRTTRIALMTAIGVTNRAGSYNRPGEHQLVLLQGDGRQAGESSDGVVARRQIAEALVRSIGSREALRKTFELVAATGEEPGDFARLFAPPGHDHFRDVRVIVVTLL
jgi:hypothetical protein